jgi:hypothetical protein
MTVVGQSVVLAVAQPLPVFLEQRTSQNRRGWSVSCQKATSAPYSITSSARASSLRVKFIMELIRSFNQRYVDFNSKGRMQ